MEMNQQQQNLNVKTFNCRNRCSWGYDGLSPVDVEGCDDFGEGHVGRDGSRHTHLVNLQVGVGRDDRSGREVHTFTHQVTADAALFPLQTLFKGLEGTARFLHSL